MKTVKMLVEVSGTRDGERWPPIGETMTLPPAEAERYAAQKFVEIVGDTPKTPPAKKKAAPKKKKEGDA